MSKEIIPKRCEEHELYFYKNGFVFTCKLGCIYQDHLIGKVRDEDYEYEE